MTKIQTHPLDRSFMVYCTECGREQADMAKFCRYCGERMPGLDLAVKLKQEATAIQQAKSRIQGGQQLNNVATPHFF